MLMAVLFADDGGLDIDQFLEFLEGINMKDPIGEDEFREWIGRSPEILTYIEDVFRGFWNEYCRIMLARTPQWAPKIEASHRPLKEFFGRGNVPNLVLAPNLFASPFATDFVKLEGATAMIACKPDVENILQEVLRDSVGLHSKKIAVFCEEYGDEYVTQECFVRALSTILAGGGEGRMQSHVNCGFVGVPTIAKYFEEHRPKAENLTDFIETVLKGMEV